MSACCRRVTAAAAAAAETPAAGHHISPRFSSSINYLHVNHRQFWKGRGAGGVVLRSRRWVIEAAVAPRGGEEEDEVKKRGQPPRCCSFDREAVAVAKGNDEGVDRRAEVMVAAAATVVLGVGNRVLYKLALVPLKHYPFFLAQFATFGYSFWGSNSYIVSELSCLATCPFIYLPWEEISVQPVIWLLSGGSWCYNNCCKWIRYWFSDGSWHILEYFDDYFLLVTSC